MWRFNALMMPMRANIVGPAGCSDKDQGFHRRLPFRRRVLGLRALRDVGASLVQRDELATARQRDRIIEWSFPAAICLHVEGVIMTVQDW
jgi:hypothetical protein